MKVICVVVVLVFTVLALSSAQFEMDGNRGLRTAMMMNAMQPAAPAPMAAPKAGGGDEAGGKGKAPPAGEAAPAPNNNAAAMLGFGLLGE